jgi:hypothetical protein
MCQTFHSENLVGKEPYERPRHRFCTNIRMYRKEVEHEGVEWIYLDQYRVKRQAVMKSVIFLEVLLDVRNFTIR